MRYDPGGRCVCAVSPHHGDGTGQGAFAQAVAALCQSTKPSGAGELERLAGVSYTAEHKAPGYQKTPMSPPESGQCVDEPGYKTIPTSSGSYSDVTS